MAWGMFGIKFLGGPGLIRTLEETGGMLKVQQTRNAVARGMMKAAESTMAAPARALAPKDDNHLAEAVIVTDKLSKSQKKGYTRKATEVVVFMGVKAGRETNVGIFQEFGTDERFQASGKSVGDVTPHPFIRPAFEAGAQPFLADVAPLVGAEVEKAAERARRKNARLAAKGGK